MSDLITQETDLSRFSTQDLKRQLASDLELTGEVLTRMAIVVAELERRGEDLSDLKIGLVPYLRLIAAKQLSANAVVRFASKPSLLNAIGQLPLADQERLASGERVQLAVMRDGVADHRMVDPMDLSAQQIRQVFGGHRINTVAQQVPLLEHTPAPRKREPKRRVRPDAERNGIVVGRSFAPQEEVLEALALLRDADYSEDFEGESILNIKLSSAEHRQLKVRAAKSGVGMNWLVRRALSAHGLIRGEEEE